MTHECAHVMPCRCALVGTCSTTSHSCHATTTAVASLYIYMCLFHCMAFRYRDDTKHWIPSRCNCTNNTSLVRLCHIICLMVNKLNYYIFVLTELHLHTCSHLYYMYYEYISIGDISGHDKHGSQPQTQPYRVSETMRENPAIV